MYFFYILLLSLIMMLVGFTLVVLCQGSLLIFIDL